MGDKRSLSVIMAFAAGVLAAITFLMFLGLPNKYLYGMLIAVLFVAFVFTGDIQKKLLGSFLILAAISLNIEVWNVFGVDTTVIHRGGEQPVIKLWISQLPFILMFALWILNTASRKKKIIFTSIDIPAALFLVLSASSFFVTTRIDLSVVHFIRMVFFYFVYLYLVNNIKDIKTLYFALRILFIGLLLQSLLAYAQYWFHIPFSMGEGGFNDAGYELLFLEGATMNRVQGTIGFPNTFGLYLAMMLQLVFAVWLAGDSKTDYLTPIVLILGFIALVMTYSRGAWIGFFVSCSFIFFMLHSRGLIRVKVGPMIAIGVLFCVFLLSFFGHAIFLRLTTSRIETSIDRIKLMKVAWEMIKAHPVMGIGLNTFTNVMKYYDRVGVSSYLPLPVHNYFLLVAAETGLGSLFAFLAIIAAAFKMAIKCLKQPFFRSLSVIMTGAAGAILAVLVANSVDCTIRHYPIGLFLWIMLGFIGAGYNMYKQYTSRLNDGS